MRMLPSYFFKSLLLGILLLSIWLETTEAKKSTFSGSLFGSKGRAVADIANPMEDPLSCGRNAVAKSAICDPDQIIPKEKQDAVEGYINAITNAEIAVVVIQKMHMKGIASRNIDDAAEEFAKLLHNKWGVGNKETNNGIVVFLSIDDRIVYISTGVGVKKEVNYDTIQSIISGMRPLLRKSDYGGAIAQAIIEIDLALNGKFDSKIRGAYGGINRGSNGIEESSESNGESFVAFGFFGIFLGIAFFLQYRRNRQLRGYERGTAALNSIMREVERAEDNRFNSTSCPICLEDFPKPEVIRLEEELPNGINPPSSTPSTLSPETAQPADHITDGGSQPEDVKVNDNANFVNVNPEIEDETLRRRRGDIANNGTPTGTGINCNGIDSSNNNISGSSSSTSEDERKKVMALRCGHAFCRGCLEDYLRSPNAFNCPICRTSVEGGDAHPPQQPPAHPQTQTRTTASQTQTVRRRGGVGGLFTSFTNRSSAQYDYTSTTTRLQENTGSGSATATYTQTTTEPSGTSSSSGINDGNDGGMFGGTSSMFRRRSPEFRFRLHRMHHMYPDIMTIELLRAMSYHVDQGQVYDFRNQAYARTAEINRIVTDIRRAAEQSARNNGMRGSSRGSFGGGSSGGGGGGRW